MDKIRLEYKGYFGVYNFSEEDVCWHGKLDEIRDLVTFEADKFEHLPSVFIDAVDDYIEICKQVGKERDAEKCALPDIINCPSCGSTKTNGKKGSYYCYDCDHIFK